MLRTNTKPHQFIKHAKISYSIVALVFRKLSYRIYWNGLNGGYLKAEVLQVPPKVRTVLVRYLLSGIRILVYSCTGCGTSKIYLCLEDNRSSFTRVSLKSETKSINSGFLLIAKDMIFGKQKFDVEQLEDKQFYVSC